MYQWAVCAGASAQWWGQIAARNARKESAARNGGAHVHGGRERGSGSGREDEGWMIPSAQRALCCRWQFSRLSRLVRRCIKAMLLCSASCSGGSCGDAHPGNEGQCDCVQLDKGRVWALALAAGQHAVAGGHAQLAAAHELWHQAAAGEGWGRGQAGRWSDNKWGGWMAVGAQEPCSAGSWPFGTAVSRQARKKRQKGHWARCRQQHKQDPWPAHPSAASSGQKQYASQPLGLSKPGVSNCSERREPTHPSVASSGQKL